MKVRRSARVAAFAVAVMAFAGSMTGIAWAPKNLFGSGLSAACDVKDGGAGSFQGSLTITGFTVVKDQLAGVGSMTGTCTPNGGGRTGKPVEIPHGTSVLVPLSIDLLTCDVLDLLLGDVAVGDVGMSVYLSGRHLAVAPMGKAERARFCAAARVIATHPAVEKVIPLNHLIFQ